MELLTWTLRDLHRRAFLVPKSPVHSRPNTELLVDLVFELGGSFTGQEGWNCAFHCITRKIYAAKADETIKFRTHPGMSK